MKRGGRRGALHVLPMFEAALAGEISYGQNMSVLAEDRPDDSTTHLKNTFHTSIRFVT